jgi:subtilisin family serine protease
MNCSWGLSNNLPLEWAIRDAQSDGITVVVASGNDNSSNPTYPCAYPGVVGVAGVNDDGVTKYSMSNYNATGASWVDVAAPATSLCCLSRTSDSSYTSFSTNGTSLAAPIVTGVVALIKARYPEKDKDWILNRLYSTAKHLDPTQQGQPEEWAGYGLVNAEAALNLTTTYDDETFDSDPRTAPGSATGWSQLGQTDTTLVEGAYASNPPGALLMTVKQDPSRFRSAGFIANQSEWLPYSSIGSDHYVRAKYYIYTGGNAGLRNQIPNLKVRLGCRRLRRVIRS